jgi:hypothetical protein
MKMVRMKNRDKVEEMMAKLFGSTSRPRILNLLLGTLGKRFISEKSCMRQDSLFRQSKENWRTLFVWEF